MPRATDLPVEMLEIIFSHLEAHELVKCRRVCKTWKEIVTIRDSLWPTEVIITREISAFCSVNGLQCDTLDDMAEVCKAMSKLGRKITSLVVNRPYPKTMMTFFVFRCFLPLENIDIDVQNLSYENVGCLLDRESLRSLRSFKAQVSFWSGDVTKFLNVLNFVRAQEIHELYISGHDCEAFASRLISISPKLSSLSLCTLNYSQIVISHNHLSSLRLNFKNELPQLACPNLTKLRLLVENHILARGTNNVPLKVELLLLEYDDLNLDDVKEIVSFYNLGSTVKCLMAHQINPPYQVREEIVALFPHLQTCWRESYFKLADHSIRVVVNNCPDLKVFCCADPGVITEKSRKLLENKGITVALNDSTNICEFCHHVHIWG
jgi:hypothetical protein